MVSNGTSLANERQKLEEEKGIIIRFVIGHRSDFFIFTFHYCCAFLLLIILLHLFSHDLGTFFCGLLSNCTQQIIVLPLSGASCVYLYDLIGKCVTKYFPFLNVDFVTYYCIFIINKNTHAHTKHKIHYIPSRFHLSHNGTKEVASFRTCFVLILSPHTINLFLFNLLLVKG